MTSYTVYFDGHLTTDSPFANSPAETSGPNKEALLPRLPQDIGGAIVNVPVIPAAPIRGGIRRASAAILVDRFQMMGEPIAFIDHLLWTTGGIKSSGSEKLEEARTRNRIIENSALLAMFGAGQSPAGGMVGGRFFVDPGIPDRMIEPGLVKGARAPENRNPALINFLSPEEMDRVQMYSDANAARAGLKNRKAKVERDVKKAERARGEKKPDAPSDEALNTLKGELKRLTDELEAAEAVAKEMGSDNSIGRPLPGYEVFPAGVSVPHRMQIKAATNEQIGFIVDALGEFAMSPMIGAHKSSGCGRISARYDVRIREGRNRATAHVGTLSYSERDGLMVDSDFLNRALEAWKNAPFDPDAYRAAPVGAAKAAE